MFEGSFQDVSTMFQGSFKGVSRKIEGCGNGILSGFQGCMKYFQWLFEGIFKGVSEKFFERPVNKIQFNGASRISNRSSKGVSREF